VWLDGKQARPGGGGKAGLGGGSAWSSNARQLGCGPRATRSLPSSSMLIPHACPLRPNPQTPQTPQTQIYLGGFGSEDEAALAYDVAAVKFRGAEAQTNFPVEGYAAEMGARDKVGRTGWGAPTPEPACGGDPAALFSPCLRLAKTPANPALPLSTPRSAARSSSNSCEPAGGGVRWGRGTRAAHLGPRLAACLSRPHSPIPRCHPAPTRPGGATAATPSRPRRRRAAPAARAAPPPAARSAASAATPRAAGRRASGWAPWTASGATSEIFRGLGAGPGAWSWPHPFRAATGAPLPLSHPSFQIQPTHPSPPQPRTHPP
jgi:hypothetical protein